MGAVCTPRGGPAPQLCRLCPQRGVWARAGSLLRDSCRPSERHKERDGAERGPCVTREGTSPPPGLDCPRARGRVQPLPWTRRPPRTLPPPAPGPSRTEGLTLAEVAGKAREGGGGVVLTRPSGWCLTPHPPNSRATLPHLALDCPEVQRFSFLSRGAARPGPLPGGPWGLPWGPTLHSSGPESRRGQRAYPWTSVPLRPFPPRLPSDLSEVLLGTLRLSCAGAGKSRGRGVGRLPLSVPQAGRQAGRRHGVHEERSRPEDQAGRDRGSSKAPPGAL